MRAKRSNEQEFENAAASAKRWAEQDGLFPSVNEDGEERYRIQQGLRAACQGREDIAALVIIQHSVLRRLEQLRVVGMIGLVILAYIAVRIS